MPGLSAADVETAAANLLRGVELERVLGAFENTGLKVWILKGMGLLQTDYHDSYHRRPMGDTDLLVEPDNLSTACELLESLGYHRYPSRDHLFRRLVGNDYLVDLHHELDHLTPAGLAAVRARSRPVSVAGRPALVLAPDDNFLYIACHMGLHHAYLTPTGLADMDRLVRGHALDYAAIARMALEFGVSAPVSEVLRVLVDRLGTPLPAGFLEALRPSPVAARWYRHILRHNQGLHGFGIILSVLFVGTPPERLARLLRYVFPDPDTIARRYPVTDRVSSWRHRLRRPFTLLRRTAGILRTMRRAPIW